MTNKIILFVFLTTLFLFSRPLWAQSSGGGRYVIEQRYVQQLVWIGDEYTLKYEVVIEKEEGGKYKTYMNEFTEFTSIQVSLPLGKYRYRIIPYDYLEQPGEASKWINFEIKPTPGVPPVITEEKEQKTPSVNDTVTKKHDEPETQEEPGTGKPISLYASAVWSPLIPLYGRLQEIFENKFYAAGATVRFGALYNELSWFKPGIELLMSWHTFNNNQGGDGISIQTGVTGFNIVAQKELPFPKMAVALRTGFALAYQVGKIDIEDYSYTTGGLIPQINIEASFIWFAYKQLYLEGGIGFTHLFGKDGNSGFLRPSIGAGWRF